MHINYYKTYIQTIKSSVGSKMFQEFYIDETNILNGGSVSCAYYVSNILKQFNLTSVGRANVPRVIEDLKKKGRQEISTDTSPKNIPIGSIVVWQPLHGETYNKDSYHIGFYMGDEICISNNSNGYQSEDGKDYVPVRHHYTYNNTRDINHIFTWDWSNPFADWLYHHEIMAKHICSVGYEELTNHGLTDDEIIFRSGKNEGMKYGRLCGAACITIIANYLCKSGYCLKDSILYADDEIQYTSTKQQEKIVTCYKSGIGWYHDGLVHIAKKLGEKKGITITGLTNTISPEEIYNVVKQSIIKNNEGEDNLLIASVTLGFDTSKEKKGGHLVVISGIDFNGYEHSIIVLDSIEKNKKQIPLQQFIDSFSGKYIIIKKSSE